MLEGGVTASRGHFFDVIQFSISTSDTVWKHLWLPVLQMSNNWHSCCLRRPAYSLMCAHTLYVYSYQCVADSPCSPRSLISQLKAFVSLRVFLSPSSGNQWGSTISNTLCSPMIFNWINSGANSKITWCICVHRIGRKRKPKQINVIFTERPP